MKTVDSAVFQGDVCFRRVDRLPADTVEQPRRGSLVVSHSETGHHHAIDDGEVTRHFTVPGDPLVCYLQLGDDYAGGGPDVVHHRAWDTHETVRLLGQPGAVWEVRRQREWTPEGWRRVQD